MRYGQGELVQISKCIFVYFENHNDIKGSARCLRRMRVGLRRSAKKLMEQSEAGLKKKRITCLRSPLGRSEALMLVMAGSSRY